MAGLEGKILDRYELRRLIGRGGMADVYEAYDPSFQRVVAVKVFKREDEDMLRRFIREARLMASLSNGHLVPIYDTGASHLDGVARYYIVMPFMEGGTLRARIRRSALSLPDACRCLDEIADALDYIHGHGIIHRDIKASNVLLDADGHCYLSDFGIARTTTDSTQLTSTGNILGTVEYVAPELFEVGYKANARSDLYSLGVLLFEMVTGQLPFSAENQIALVSMHMNKRPPSPRSIIPQIPPAVERVMLKALEKKPELRYASATELAQAFCRAVAGGTREDWQEAAPFAPFGGENVPTLPTAQPPLVLGPPPVAVRPATSFAPPPSATYVPPPSPPLRSSTGSRRRGWIVTLLALLSLLVISASVVFAIVQSSKNSTIIPTTPAGSAVTATQPATPSPTATPNLTATAQSAATATVVAQVHATATAQARGTATAQAQASATAGVIQTATAGKPVYRDALNDPTNPATQSANWDRNSHCVFASNGYHVKQAADLVGLHGCREAANSYQDLALTVDVRLFSGHSGGVFFRLSTDVLGNYSGYLFEIDSAGNYKISNFHAGSAAPLQDWTSTSALRQGYNVKNTLQAIAHGTTLSFYINGVYLVSLTDSTYSNGNIAFLATAADSDADVAYSNLSVFSLSQ